MDTGSVLVILFSSNIIGGLSDNLVSLYSSSPSAEYVDIDEGAIVKVEFSKTLSGMMSAMEEIQGRADNIMENIMEKEGELAEIQSLAKQAELEKKALEDRSNQMLDEKAVLENDIGKLIHDKADMENHIKQQENEVIKTKFLLAPLAEKVTNLESELSSLTNQITRKQEELTNLKIEIVESGGTNGVSEADSSQVSILAPVLGISLLFNLIILLSLVLAYISQQSDDSKLRRQERPERKTYPEDNSEMISPVPDLLSIGPNINTEWSDYPSAVQDAISALKAQYELEDGELEAVVRNLWEEE